MNTGDVIREVWHASTRPAWTLRLVAFGLAVGLVTLLVQIVSILLLTA